MAATSEPETPEDHATTVDRAWATVLPLSETYEIPAGGSITIDFGHDPKDAA